MQDELLRLRSSAMVVASGFRWRRSRWGRNCPVALKEGHIVPGQPEFSVRWVVQVRKTFKFMLKLDWIKCFFVVSYLCAAFWTRCTSCRLRRLTRSSSQTLGPTCFPRCPGSLAGSASSGRRKQGRPLCVGFWLSPTTHSCWTWMSCSNRFCPRKSRRELTRSKRRQRFWQ